MFTCIDLVLHNKRDQDCILFYKQLKRYFIYYFFVEIIKLLLK